MPNIGGPIGRSWLDASREGMLLLSRVFIPSRITILPGVPPNELNLDESINGFDVRGEYVFPGYTLSSLVFREIAQYFQNLPSITRILFSVEKTFFFFLLSIRFLIRKKKKGKKERERKIPRDTDFDPRFEEVNRICDFR